MQDDHSADAMNFTPEDEDRVLRSIQRSLVMMAEGTAAIRRPLEQLARDRERHLDAAIGALRDAKELPSAPKISATSSIVFDEAKNTVKDVVAAAIRAMTCAATTARRFQEEMTKYPPPFGMSARQSAGESPFTAPPHRGRDRSDDDG
jgi:hypothetical protein